MYLLLFPTKYSKDSQPTVPCRTILSVQWKSYQNTISGIIKRIGNCHQFRGMWSFLDKSIEKDNFIGQYAFQDKSAGPI